MPPLFSSRIQKLFKASRHIQKARKVMSVELSYVSRSFLLGNYYAMIFLRKCITYAVDLRFYYRRKVAERTGRAPRERARSS